MGQKKLEFKVSSSPSLELKDLCANVVVKVGQDNLVTVSITGDDKAVDKINVRQPNPDSVSITGSVGKTGTTFINSRGGSVSIRGRGICISGDADGVVIVNGKVIKGDVTVINEGEEKLLDIEITVPQKTDIDADGVNNLNASRVCGKVYLTLHEQGRAIIEGATDTRVNCSGQSSVQLYDVQGNLRASCSGQSSVIASGEYGDIEADASGQSHIRISGPCQDVEANASGMSTIAVVGNVRGKVRQHDSGMSTVRIN